MDRNEYLQALDLALRPLTTRREREDILRYYTEYFEDAGPEGEAEVIATLGDPAELARSTARQAASYPLPEEDEPDPDDPAERGFSLGKLARWAKKRWVRLLAGGVCLLAALLLAFALWSRQQSTPPTMEWVMIDGSEMVYTTDLTNFVQEKGGFTSVHMTGSVSLRILPGTELRLTMHGDSTDILSCPLGYQVREDGVLSISCERQGTLLSPVLVELTLPPDAALEDLTADISEGTVEIGEVQADTVWARSEDGDVTLNSGQLAYQSVELHTVYGDIFQSGLPAADLTVTSNFGSIWLRLYCAQEDCDYVLKSFVVNPDTVRINGKYAGNNATRHEYGADGENYSIMAATGTGNIAVDFMR